MNTIKPIGGFFELELPNTKTSYHPRAIALSTGRACLRLMIQNLQITKCYLPFYTCDAVYDPFKLENIEIELYGLNEDLEPKSLPVLKKGEYFLYINYFGVKSEAVKRLILSFGSSLLIDDTHLFFNKGYEKNWSFTSARKYFGVPDGAYLYAPNKLTVNHPRFAEVSITHNLFRLLGKQQQSYKEYELYEKSLTSDIHQISVVSEGLLSLVDYEMVKSKRIENFTYLHEQLGGANKFIISMPKTDVPFAYPFLPATVIDKKPFYNDNLFIPSLWLDPSKRKKSGFEWDEELGVRILPLPIDHRYDINDMKLVAEKINEVLKAK